MIPPTVVYIDDDVSEKINMQRAFKSRGNIRFILPQLDINELVDDIFSFHPDAIVVDFRLSEHLVGIEYDGYDILQLVLERKEKFPIFILTSQENDAFTEVDDVNFVYEKDQLDDEGTFVERVIRQISKHKQQLANNEAQILELIEKSRHEPLTKAEEDKLIELDGLVERGLDKKSAVPDDLKVSSNERRLVDILTRVDALVKKVNDRLPEP